MAVIGKEEAIASGLEGELELRRKVATVKGNLLMVAAENFAIKFVEQMFVLVERLLRMNFKLTFSY